jgi:hypothetical protein
MPSDSTIRCSETPAIASIGSILLFFLVIFVFAPSFSQVWAAPPAPTKPNAQHTEPETIAPGQIGNSGYVVPIPEIKMKSIIGNQPPRKAQPEPPPVKETPAVEQPPTKEESSSPESGAEFDEPPPSEAPAVAPVKKREPSAEPSEKTMEAPEADQVDRLPFDPAYRIDVGRPREVGPQPPKVEEKKIESPLASPPAAPETTIDAPPVKKEVLKGKVAVTPPNLLEAAPVKGGTKTSPVERMTIAPVKEFAEGIPFSGRGEPEALPPEPVTPPAKVADISRPEPPVPEPSRLEPPFSEPEKVAPPAPQHTPEEVEEKIKPEEPPSVEEPSPPSPPSPPPARLASPLEPDALTSRDVKEYLTQTSPILEELSLLMTRAPSLAIADFDPSDPNTVIFPKEIYVKIDAMKRALQVLDSKAFAIIPPAKYAAFHSVIRDSIIQTYQACDAMINYFNERSDENLKKVHEHLMKARELVQRTHLAQG